MIFTGEDILVVPLEKAQVARFAETVRSRLDWQDIVPGLGDCALRFDPERVSADEALAAAQDALAALDISDESSAPPAENRLAAHVGGRDSAMVAKRLGIEEEALAEWLAARRYRVALVGFQPGFAYLDDCNADDLPDIGRLDAPRQRIAAGSIGFLGGRACLYSQDGPGGWPIVGRIDARLFDPAGDPPALLAAGDIVQFVAA